MKKDTFISVGTIILFLIMGIGIGVYLFNSQVVYAEVPIFDDEPETHYLTIEPEIIPLGNIRETNDISRESSEEVFSPRYGFTDEDVYILAQLLCGDESYDGDGEYDFVYGALHDEMNGYEMSKVLCVVMNRVRDPNFPDTVSDVIFAAGQFADNRRIHTTPAPIAIEKIKEWCDAYDRYDMGVQCIPEDHLYFEAGDNLTNVTSTTW